MTAQKKGIEASEQKKTEQAKYNARKTKALEFEEQNFGKIMLVKSSEHFYKVFGRSSLLLQFEVAPRTKKEYRRQVDRDYVGKSKVGYISIPKTAISKLKQDFLNLDANYKIEKDTTDFVILDLGRTYSTKELMDMYTKDKETTKMLNRTVHPNQTAPSIYLKLEDIATMIVHNVKKMPPEERNLFGLELYQISAQMLTAYIEWCDAVITTELAREKLSMLIAQFKSRLIIMNTISTTVKQRTKIYFGMAVAELRELIEKEMKDKKRG